MTAPPLWTLISTMCAADALDSIPTVEEPPYWIALVIRLISACSMRSASAARAVPDRLQHDPGRRMGSAAFLHCILANQVEVGPCEDHRKPFRRARPGIIQQIAD